MSLHPGTRLGPYEVTERIGGGGMGEVYRARDPRLGRDVAIKIITASPDAELLARFERETRATAVLAHPNILTIFDVGSYDGLPFLVSELLEGQTLGRRLASGPLAPQAAVDLALQLARGVAAAHALRIVHRDLKPDNLFVTTRGTLKILDFGLAKLKAAADALETTMEASHPGRLIGTPAYMSPEQLRGGLADERSDIFAIGTVLYEMITGRHPFRRATVVATLTAILHEPVAPIADSGDTEAALEHLLQHCLEKDPESRFQAADDLVDALESLQHDLRHAVSPLRDPPAGPSGSSIAVLPFADLSPARDQGHLGGGIAGELIDVLARVPGVKVTPRSSSFQFTTPDVDVRAIGARLGVANVLEGSLRRSGDRLRVTVQLVDVALGFQRWSRRFDGQIDDVFAIQDEIAIRVATSLHGLLTDRERQSLRRPPTCVESYEYFLRGRQRLFEPRADNVIAARAMFERAIDADPDYAPAWAGLADVHAWLYTWLGGTRADYDAADRASIRALELAPDLAEAQSARGVALSLARRYDESERAFEDALRLNPASFDAAYLYARMLLTSGRIDRAADLFRRAADLRADDFQSPMLLGQCLRRLGRDADAAAAHQEGVRKAERQLDLDPRNTRALSLGAGSLFAIGHLDRAMQWATRALEIDPDDGAVLAATACLYARLGMNDRAFELLEKLAARGIGQHDVIEQDPDYDVLRGDPRFGALIARLR